MKNARHGAQTPPGRRISSVPEEAGRNKRFVFGIVAGEAFGDEHGDEFPGCPAQK
jgi:hypothetical protein